MKIINAIQSYSKIEWLIFLVVIANISPWIIWGYGLSAPVQYVSVLMLFIAMMSEKRMQRGKGGLVFLLLLLYFVIGQVLNDIHFSYAFIALAYLMAAKVSQKECSNVLNMLTTYVLLSILIPLPLWLIHQYVTPLPVVGVFDIGSWKGSGSVLMENHFFFVTYQGLDAMRFYSWYDEPGVLGTFAPFILYANKFNMKDWRIPIILIGSLFTFSMAYIVLTLVGWMWTSRKSAKTVVLTLAGIVLIGYGMYYALSDNLAFQQSVVSRVLNTEETGVDSRNGYERDVIWDRNIGSANLVFGLGSGAMNKYGGIATHYKSFILEFGFVGCLILFIAYFSLLKKKDIQSFFTMFLCALSFLQRPQLYTAGWFFIFVCVLAGLSDGKQASVRNCKVIKKGVY